MDREVEKKMSGSTVCSLFLVGLMILPAEAKISDFIFSHDYNFAAPGEVYIEQGLTRARRRNSFNNSRRSTSSVPMGVTYGIGDRFEVGVEVPYKFLDQELVGPNTVASAASGVGDVAIHQKLRLTDQQFGHWGSSAFGYRVEVPTGNDDKGLGNGKTDLELFAVGIREISFAKLMAGFGYNFIGGSNVDNEFMYNFGINAAIKPGFSLVLEVNGVAGTEDRLYVSPGFVVDTQLGFSVRAGVGFGLSKESYKYRWAFIFSNSF